MASWGLQVASKQTAARTKTPALSLLQSYNAVQLGCVAAFFVLALTLPQTTGKSWRILLEGPAMILQSCPAGQLSFIF